MIGTDEMSSTGMDISESFRPEDLSKTDFFDFVTAPDMGIGIGVGVGVGVGVSLHSHHLGHERIATTNMTHDGGGGGSDSTTEGRGSGSVSAGSSDGSGRSVATDNSALQGYEFWNTDKEHSRLESTIFEDLDRYCWQQQQQQHQQQHQQQQSNTHQQLHSPTTHSAHNNPSSPNQQLGTAASCNNNNNNHNLISTCTNTPITGNNGNGNGNTNNLDNTDGQIYTLTVLNGNEPWLKRDQDVNTQLSSALDLDSLLGNFSGYIKSEYPYDDSGFGTDGTKDLNSDANGIGMASVTGTHNVMTTLPEGGQSLPSLVTAISVAGAGNVGNGGLNNMGQQQLAQFQNNNNDWHMADHNADHNSAESLLRSALQGKGYSKGLHMHNGITLLPSSPTIKDDEMRRMLFSTDTDSMSFGDSSLAAAQIFNDTQNPTTHSPHLLIPHASEANGPNANTISNSASGVSSIIVDDMFLSLESAFSDEFEKIKRIANDVQQFCTSTPTPEYGGNELLMQMSPITTTQLQQMQHSPATTPTGPPPQQTMVSTPSASMHLQPPTPAQPPPPQPHKQEVSTSSSRISTTTTNATTTKTTKKYKRSSSVAHNNNNPNAINQNNTSNGSNVPATKHSNTNVNATGNVNANNGGGSSSGSNSSNSPTHCNGGQRKERSLHYCSICSKGFKDKYSVNVHIRTHTGEKPFACSLCGKSFRQKAHLAKHYQTHMAQKNNGHIVKGGSAKHHRSTAAIANPTGGGSGGGGTNIVGSSNTVVQHRLLNSATLGNGNSALLGPAIPTLTGSASAVNILPPANGLLTNR